MKRRLGLELATLGADMGYDAGEFLGSLETRGIEPHVACKSRGPIGVPDPEDRGAWARWYNQRGSKDAGYGVSQRKRKLTEEIFGWLKQYGGLRRSRVVGRWKIQQLATCRWAR